MNTDTAEAMVGFLYTVPGLAVLVWALYAGILRRAPDQVMYQVVEDGQEPDAAQIMPPNAVSPRRVRWFLAIIVVLFTVIAVSTVATVVIATTPANTTLAHPTSTATGKCPFF